jgi:hypothetical protein
MDRILALGLLALAVVAASTCTSSARRAARVVVHPELAGVPRSGPVWPAVDAAERVPVAASDRAGTDEPATARVAPSGDVVHVHGRVHRGRWPQTAFDLHFEPRDDVGGPGEGWDRTDSAAAFEVDLLPGRYAVRNGEDGDWLADVTVPGGAESIELDLELRR